METPNKFSKSSLLKKRCQLRAPWMRSPEGCGHYFSDSGRNGGRKKGKKGKWNHEIFNIVKLLDCMRQTCTGPEVTREERMRVLCTMLAREEGMSYFQLPGTVHVLVWMWRRSMTSFSKTSQSSVVRLNKRTVLSYRSERWFNVPRLATNKISTKSFCFSFPSMQHLVLYLLVWITWQTWQIENRWES
jgi:hypothetical protein